ncbi:MAG: hypothetical protein SCARUB_03019 [Candidatus Scalindua rubra]|uniref:Uncharacterized protein n=1 Tax=Candidatus Scalindua rubra TaxID=1872076 RepID=A0A1E3X8B5_9BACT|nr:MAG: hypothetical protein SCARUB_03019 [Candidatus Scalindua rubra]
MPETKIDIPIKNIAKMIDSMNKQEIETLYMLLTKDGKELLKRKKDLELKRVKFLSRDETFNV